MEGKKIEKTVVFQDEDNHPENLASLMLELGQLEIRVKSRKKKLSPDLEKELDESFDKLIQDIFNSYRASDKKWKKDLKLLRETAQELDDIHTKEDVLPDELKSPKEQRKNMFSQRINALRKRISGLDGCVDRINALIETMKNDSNAVYTADDYEQEKSCWNALIGFENMNEEELQNIDNMMKSYETLVKNNPKSARENNTLH